MVDNSLSKSSFSSPIGQGDAVPGREAAIRAMMGPIDLLIGEAQIRHAIESLPPLVQEACRVALSRMPDIQNIKNNRQLLCETVVTSFAMVGLPKGIKSGELALAVDAFGPKVVQIVYSSLDVIDGVYSSRGSSAGRWAALAGGLVGLLLVG